MSLTITAKLTDAQGKPLSGLDAQLLLFLSTGATKAIGAGRSLPDGALTVSSTFTPTADYQPRLQLVIKSGTAVVAKSEQPVTFTSATCDFGAITVLPAGQLGGISAAEADSLRGKVSGLEKANLTLSRRVEELTGEADRVRETLTAQHGAQLQQRDAQILQKDAQIKAQADKIAALEKAAGADLSIEDLAQETAEQLQRTQSALSASRGGFRLGKVSMQLKVLPGRSGGRVAMAGAADIERVGAGGLSLVSMDFHPQEPRSARPAPPQVPRVIGYTESLARRKLAEQRLGVEVAYQLVESDAEVGRVITQQPAEKTQLQEGATVTVAIGKRG